LKVVAPHGNAKEETEYIRTQANVMSDMSNMLKCDNGIIPHTGGISGSRGTAKYKLNIYFYESPTVLLMLE
jgi:hypothetical protein